MNRTTFTYIAGLVGAAVAAAGCGNSGSGNAQIFVEGEDTIVNGLDPGTELENVKDGWTVRYDKFLITLGNVRASQSTKPSARLSEPKTFVLDMRAIPS